MERRLKKKSKGAWGRGSGLLGRKEKTGDERGGDAVDVQQVKRREKGGTEGGNGPWETELAGNGEGEKIRLKVQAGREKKREI